MAFDLFSSESNAYDQRKVATDQGLILGSNAQLGGFNVDTHNGGDISLYVSSYGSDALDIPRNTLSPNTNNVNSVASTIDWGKLFKLAGYAIGGILVVWLASSLLKD